MKKGFTLAEVLITLGIIGVVAALTMPVISENVQKIVLKNQFKKFYSNFSNAILQAQQNLGYPQGCWYRDSGQLCPEVCVKTNDYGTCVSWTCKDGSSLPKYQNGMYTECPQFEDELFNRVLKTVKFCQKNALANGCLLDSYKGLDKLRAEINPDIEQDPSLIFSDNNIKKNSSVWILNDSTMIIRHLQTGYGYNSLYAVDINGHKGPNKWGYDMCTFKLVGNESLGVKKIGNWNVTIESGGTSCSQMFENAFAQ